MRARAYIYIKQYLCQIFSVNFLSPGRRINIFILNALGCTLFKYVFATNEIGLFVGKVTFHHLMLRDSP